MPFCSQLERDIHFAKHGHKFAAVDPAEYEKMADEFMFGVGPDVRDCIRPNNGDRVRFGIVTHLLGVSRRIPAPECVRTFYPVSPVLIRRHRGEAGYFAYECGRVPGLNL